MNEYNHWNQIKNGISWILNGQNRILPILLGALLLGCGKTPAPNTPEIPIHEAVVRGDLKAIQDHIAAGSDLNGLDNISQSTPLMTAATFGHVDIAKALIDAGANLNIKNNDGSTALISAAFFCRSEIVQALLDKGADTNIRNNMGSTALNAVEGPWATVKPIYDMIGGMLAPSGVVLDYEHIQSTRPKIAEMLQETKAPKATKQSAPDFEVKTIVPTGDEPYLRLDSDYIFDQEKLHTFELNIPGSALAKIDADPSAEAYVEGSLSFEGQTLSPVGIRYKGSVGAWAGCLSGFDWVHPSGHKICNKLSMKIKVNWKGSDQKFYGLNKIQLHSQKSDRSQMRERLGYWLFRNMGVPAPRSVHARLIINGNYSGLYALIEQIDGRFTRHHFKNGKGNLYKEVWPLDSDGNAHNEETYLERLKTNEDEKPKAHLIHSFAKEIAAADERMLQSVITKWMDVEEIISYAVVDRMIRHDDGPFHWYCHGNECFNHNYYWYEDPIEKKLHLVPWDLDSTFENIISNTNPVTALADQWGEVTANGNPFNFGPFNIPQRSAASDKLIAGWTRFDEEFDRQLNRFMEGPFSKVQVDEHLDIWTEQIRQATDEASRTHDDAISVSEWEHAVSELKAQVGFAREKRLM
jgi:hypothetical protein